MCVLRNSSGIFQSTKKNRFLNDFIKITMAAERACLLHGTCPSSTVSRGTDSSLSFLIFFSLFLTRQQSHQKIKKGTRHAPTAGKRKKFQSIHKQNVQPKLISCLCCNRHFLRLHQSGENIKKADDSHEYRSQDTNRVGRVGWGGKEEKY
jgi:hypothetical protein